MLFESYTDGQRLPAMRQGNGRNLGISPSIVESLTSGWPARARNLPFLVLLSGMLLWMIRHGDMALEFNFVRAI